jgi:hypothetical protein
MCRFLFHNFEFNYLWPNRIILLFSTNFSVTGILMCYWFTPSKLMYLRSPEFDQYCVRNSDGHRLFGLRYSVVSISPYRIILEKYLDLASYSSFQIFTNSSFNDNSVIPWVCLDHKIKRNKFTGPVITLRVSQNTTDHYNRRKFNILNFTYLNF